MITVLFALSLLELASLMLAFPSPGEQLSKEYSRFRESYFAAAKDETKGKVLWPCSQTLINFWLWGSLIFIVEPGLLIWTFVNHMAPPWVSFVVMISMLLRLVLFILGMSGEYSSSFHQLMVVYVPKLLLLFPKLYIWCIYISYATRPAN